MTSKVYADNQSIHSSFLVLAILHVLLVPINLPCPNSNRGNDEMNVNEKDD